MATVILNIEHDEHEHARNVDHWRWRYLRDPVAGQLPGDSLTFQLNYYQAKVTGELLAEDCDAEKVQDHLAQCRALLQLIAEQAQR